MSVDLEPGTWSCQICTYINASNRTKCSMCEIIRGVHLGHIGAGLNEVVDENENSDLMLQKLKKSFENYLELAELDGTDLITCIDHFECPICLMVCEPGEGVTLKECLHTFCKACLAQAVEHSTEAEVRCPYGSDDYLCNCFLQEREIRALVNSEIYNKYLARSVTEAEQKIQNTFHCKTVNCQGWCVFEDDVNVFQCPVCEKSNCFKCRAIHSNLTCEQYRASSSLKESDKASKTRLQKMLESKEAMKCPRCEVIIMKIEGCDWMKCSVCKIEICWATRGARWGPKGTGDTTGGCRCGVNGKLCHPQCGNCH